MIQVAIYLLIDPRDQKVFYVGCTRNPEARFKQQLSNRMPIALVKRIGELSVLGLLPIFRVVKWVDARYGDYEERAEMARQLQQGSKLLQKRGTKSQVPEPEVACVPA